MSKKKLKKKIKKLKKKNKILYNKNMKLIRIAQKYYSYEYQYLYSYLADVIENKKF